VAEVPAGEIGIASRNVQPAPVATPASEASRSASVDRSSAAAHPPLPSEATSTAKPVDLDAAPRHVWTTPGAAPPPPPALGPTAPTVEKRAFRLGDIVNYIPEVMLYRALAPKIKELLRKPPAEAPPPR
jgi:hypothetical protein